MVLQGCFVYLRDSVQLFVTTTSTYVYLIKRVCALTLLLFCLRAGGSYEIVRDLSLDAFTTGKLKESEEELRQERELAFAVPHRATM